jgi:hypothetical protein
VNQEIKKEYLCPTVKKHGSVEDLTQGQMGWGDADQWWIFTWGTS